MKSIDNYAKTFEEVWAAMDRADQQMEETKKIVAETSRKVAELTASIQETRKEVGGLGNSYGMYAESYFLESLKKTKKFGGISYKFVDDDLKNSIVLPNGERVVGQYDIVMHNGDIIVIIEVKSKVQKKDVIDLIERKLDEFKMLFPHYADKKFHLGVAGFSFDKNAEEEAMNRGVGILKLAGENVEIQDGHLIVY